LTQLLLLNPTVTAKVILIAHSQYTATFAPHSNSIANPSRAFRSNRHLNYSTAGKTFNVMKNFPFTHR